MLLYICCVCAYLILTLVKSPIEADGKIIKKKQYSIQSTNMIFAKQSSIYTPLLFLKQLNSNRTVFQYDT